MQVIFKKVKYKNFLSTGNVYNEVVLDENNLTLVTGMNSAGKCMKKFSTIHINITDKKAKSDFIKYVRENKKYTRQFTCGIQVTINDVVEFYKQHSEHISKIEVDTRFGYKKILYADITTKNSDVITTSLESGKILSTSPDHLLHNGNGWIRVADLVVGDPILTDVGIDCIESIKTEDDKENLYDLQVEDVKEFYANGFVSHNSTFIDAISFALFNKPVRSVNKDQVVNSINKKNCVVELYLEISGTTYKVTRGVKPSIFTIEKDGNMLDLESSVWDQQRFLERDVLMFNRETFNQIIILGNTSYIPFMSLKPTARRKVIEDLLDLGIFGKMSNLLDEKVSDLKISIRETRHEIGIAESGIKAYEATLQSLTDHARESTKKRISKLVEGGKESSNKIDDINHWLDVQKQKLTKFSNLKLLQKNVETSKKKSAIANHKLLEIDEKLQHFRINDECPTCNKTISDISKFVEDLERSGLELELERETAKGEINRLELDIKSIKKMSSSISDSELSVKRLFVDLERKYKEIQDLKKELKAFSPDSTIGDQLDQTKIRLSQLQNIDMESSHLMSMYQSCQLLLKENGIKATVIEQYIPTINSLINSYLATMNFYVKFELNNSFVETIRSRHRDIFSYDNFSAGERMRIDIALLLTWRAIARIKNSVRTNLLIVDEVFDSSLDSDGIESALRLLGNLDKSNVFLITHKSDSLVDNFTNILHFEKIRNFSVLNS